MKTATKILLVTTAIILFMGTGALAQRQDLSTGPWKLIQAHDQPITNSLAFIQFNPGLNRFNGNTGCNQMFGSVATERNRINFSAIGTTRRACKLMAGNVSEGTFIKALKNAYRYRQSGRYLNILDRRGRTTLRFRLDQMGETDLPAAALLDERKWFLESVGARRTPVATKEAFIVFDKQKGSAGGNTGCNVFGGSYTTMSASINITDVISTMRACIEDDKMQIEREFLEGLRTATKFEIKDNRLLLFIENRLLLTLRGESK